MVEQTASLDARQVAFFQGLAERTEAGRLRWYTSSRSDGVLVARSGNAQCFIDGRDASKAATIRLISDRREQRFPAVSPELSRLHDAARKQILKTGLNLRSAIGELGL